MLLPFAGQQLPGIYVHSIPSTPEPEPPPSPSDSNDASNQIHKPIKPLGHTTVTGKSNATPVFQVLLNGFLLS